MSDPTEAAAGNGNEYDTERVLTRRVLGLPAHEERSAAVGEVHSRPHPVITSPRILIMLALIHGGADADRAVIEEMCRATGQSGPLAGQRHHVLDWGKGQLRWERHSEFSTFLFDAPANPRTFEPVGDMPFTGSFTPPGTVICGVRLELRHWTKTAEKALAGFNGSSLCYSVVEGGAAAIATDFRQDGDGLTRIVILDRNLAPARAGTLAQRAIEIETYRTLAMLGLPLAQRLGGRLRTMEERLGDLTRRMRQTDGSDSQQQLEQITALAAELEADAAASLFRFGASRAYDGIVAERLASLNEQPVAGHESWTAFLQRRLAPAMRTCRSIEARQTSLSEKLARAATLLRTRVDVELEKQNADLLTSMNRRAQLQLRLQHTVEGLSVAAVTYYVVGLVGYVAKGLKPLGIHIAPELATAVAVPVVALVIWLSVRKIRHDHEED